MVCWRKDPLWKLSIIAHFYCPDTPHSLPCHDLLIFTGKSLRCHQFEPITPREIFKNWSYLDLTADWQNVISSRVWKSPLIKASACVWGPDKMERYQVPSGWLPMGDTFMGTFLPANLPQRKPPLLSYVSGLVHSNMIKNHVCTFPSASPSSLSPDCWAMFGILRLFVMGCFERQARLLSVWHGVKSGARAVRGSMLGGCCRSTLCGGCSLKERGVRSHKSALSCHEVAQHFLFVTVLIRPGSFVTAF